MRIHSGFGRENDFPERGRTSELKRLPKKRSCQNRERVPAVPFD
jgi:hypothetical protein